MKRLLILLIAAWFALPAFAHKASDAYLQLESSEAGLSLRLDVALRDLDVALDLDSNGDGRLTWGEIKSAWPSIEAYALARLQVAGCPLHLTARALERRSDGAYAVLSLASACRPSTEPAIHYALMREVDATHRGLAKIQLAGLAPIVRVLDPSHPAVVATAAIDAGAPNAASPAPAVPPVVESHGAAAVLQPFAVQDAAPMAGSFLSEGVHHILGGYDHVLFLLCLMLPAVMRRTPLGWRPVGSLKEALLPVVGIVTAFTVAHSITLALAATRTLLLPAAIIEPAIALTIVLAAVDNLWPIFRGRRGVVTFLFGLVHGFGFADALAELALPPMQFALALLKFNLGLELGQLAIVVLAVGVLFAARRLPRYPAFAIRGGSLAAIAIGAVWLVERTANVSLLPI